MQWDVFCRVIDNFGDIGVCWRLAADLASRGERVRLWVDDAAALAWMAPHGAAGVTVLPWCDACTEGEPSDVVVEAFGCELPSPFIDRMALRRPAPVWINLEYLSAEPYVERCHGLPSPQLNGLTKWFFYPGFTARTGGLIREPGSDRLEPADAEWLMAHGVSLQAQERMVTLFCYDNGALAPLIDVLSHKPTLLLLAGAPAKQQVSAVLGPSLRRGQLRAQRLPPLPQPDFDRLLRGAALNFVRGEDSFVRAQWAGRPFVWQIYPQHDGAHGTKLNAFLDVFLQNAAPEMAASVRRLFAAWNGLARANELHIPALGPWEHHAESWRDALGRQMDLTRQLIDFVAKQRREAS
jgi:uncharacterized repeat protein (TIGR03837 family)